MAPQLSVVLPTRDRPRNLRTALTSVALQRCDDVQVVVVNDGGAPVDAVVGDYRDRLDVRVVSLPSPAGPSAARNAGLEVATGEYVSFLDDDDLYLPGHLESALRVLAHGDADAVYATAAVSEQWVDPEHPPVGLAHAFDYPFHPRFLSVLNYIPPTGLVVRTAGAPSLRFDPGLRIGEDWDLWLRLTRDDGCRFTHLDSVGVVYHRIPAHTLSADPVGEGRRMLGLFHDGYRRMCARWPVADGSPESTYRGLVLRVYDLAFARYDDGATLPPFWYERLVRLLFGAFTADLPVRDVRPLLATVLEAR
jgi:glycosyltransferase involved in cell wall biosynthesis